MSLHQLPVKSALVNGDGVAGGGEPPYDAGMEARIAKLEDFVVDARERLTKMETRLLETATKADLSDLKGDMHKGTNDTIKWIVGTAVVLMGLGITIITFVLNNAVPKSSAPQVAPNPIIITVPTPMPAPVVQTSQQPKTK